MAAEGRRDTSEDESRQQAVFMARNCCNMYDRYTEDGARRCCDELESFTEAYGAHLKQHGGTRNQRKQAKFRTSYAYDDSTSWNENYRSTRMRSHLDKRY